MHACSQLIERRKFSFFFFWLTNGRRNETLRFGILTCTFSGVRGIVAVDGVQLISRFGVL